MNKERSSRLLANLMQRPARFTIVALTLTLSAGTFRGQAIVPVKPLRLDGEVVNLTVDRERQTQVVYLKLKLKLSNTSDKPVILLLGTYGDKKEWWVLNTMVSRTLTDALDGKPFYIGPTGPANSRSFPSWKELRHRLSSPLPPSSDTQTIEPHKTFSKEIETVVVIHDDERISPESRLWLKVLLELWPGNIEPSNNDEQNKPYGESLRRKWQAVGDLQLDSILSSPIPFDLPPQGADQVSDARKKEFIDLLRSLPTKGEFYTDEAVVKAGPYLPILFALTEKDIAEYDIYPFLAISRGLCNQSEHRAYAAHNFAKIQHRTLKLFWAAMLFDSDATSAEIERFLRDALESKEEAKLLSEMLGPKFDSFRKRLRSKSTPR